jgi:hypothetical protein
VADENLERLLWLLTKPIHAKGRKGVNSLDAWLGSKYREGGSGRLWPKSVYAGKDPTPEYVRDSPDSCSEIGSLLSKLIADDHPFIELVGINSKAVDKPQLDPAIIKAIGKHYREGYKYEGILGFVAHYKK